MFKETKINALVLLLEEGYGDQSLDPDVCIEEKFCKGERSLVVSRAFL